MSENNIEVLQITPINLGNAISIIGSVAVEETALAALIQAEATKLNEANAADSLSFLINQSILSSMKTILLKNTVLEVKLRETLNFLRNEGVSPLDVNLQNNLIAVLNSIAAEETALGNLIFNLGNRIVNIIGVANLANIIAVNRSAIALMKIIVEKNMVLLKKLRDIVKFTEAIAPDNGIDGIVANLIQAIIALIESINDEENGLARLITGEVNKLRRVLTISNSVDELLQINGLVTDVIDTVVQKNMILEAKLEEIITLINLASFTPAQLILIANSLTLIQSSIAAEETALGEIITEEANKLNLISGLANVTIPQLIEANNSVENLLDSITLKNMILARKNSEVINFIQAIPSDLT